MALFTAFFLVRDPAGLPAQAFLSYFQVGSQHLFQVKFLTAAHRLGGRAVDRNRKVTAHLRRQGLICKSSFDRLAVGWYLGPKFGKADPDPGASRRSLACGIECSDRILSSAFAGDFAVGRKNG